MFWVFNLIDTCWFDLYMSIFVDYILNAPKPQALLLKGGSEDHWDIRILEIQAP